MDAKLVRAAEAEVLEAGKNATSTLCADQEGLTSYRSVFRDGADGAPAHFHTKASESFFVLGGELEVLVGEEILTLTAGDTLVVPPNTPHAFGASKGKDADVLFVFTPGMDRFDYMRLLQRVTRGEADPKELGASSDRFDNRYFESEIWKKARA